MGFSKHLWVMGTELRVDSHVERQTGNCWGYAAAYAVLAASRPLRHRRVAAPC